VHLELQKPSCSSSKQVNQHSIHLAIKGLESRIVEQIQALESEEKEANCKTMKWTALSSGVIKLNTEAAMFNNSAALPVNARDDKGSVLKAWSKVDEIIYLAKKMNTSKIAASL
jgi:hypothetical protein